MIRHRGLCLPSTKGLDQYLERHISIGDWCSTDQMYISRQKLTLIKGQFVIFETTTSQGPLSCTASPRARLQDARERGLALLACASKHTDQLLLARAAVALEALACTRQLKVARHGPLRLSQSNTVNVRFMGLFNVVADKVM